jgi:dolichyl-diphosphooligosaccharide--protein glycosyltransferase
LKKRIFVVDLHLLICLFPVGAWFCIKELNDERVFIVLYAVFASYFAGVMVRLMLTLTPCVCVLGKKKKTEDFICFVSFLAAIALSKTLDYYADTETSEMTSSTNESTNDDNETESNNRNLYDKAGKITKRRNGTNNNNNQDGEDDQNIVSSNIKTIVVICSKLQPYFYIGLESEF